MKTIIQEYAPLIRSAIDSSHSILLHCHPHADPDSVGSALAMKFALEGLGKKVTVIQGDSPISKEFHFPGIESIVPQSVPQTDFSQFDLFIMQDSGSLDMVSRNPFTLPDSLQTIVIDHHITNTKYGKINCVDPSYSSTAELLHDLFKEMNIPLNHDIALNLFMGMYTDTGGFRHENTTTRSWETAVELIHYVPDYHKTIFIMENSRSLNSLRFEGIAWNSIQTFYDNKLVVVAISYDDLKKHDISLEDASASYISNKLKSVIGFDIAVTLVEYEPGIVKGSLRTRNSEKYDLSVLARGISEVGGGHKAAAGFSIKGTVSQAIEQVVKTVKDVYNF